MKWTTERKQAFQLLRAAGLSIATAESCTGGLLAKALTDLSGSSAFFRGGVVTYSNQAKSQVLGVRIGEGESAVKKRVALEMARGVRHLFQSDLGLATTGFMTPDAAMKRQFRKLPQNQTGVFFVALSGVVKVPTGKQSKTVINPIKNKKSQRKTEPKKFQEKLVEICLSFDLYNARGRNRLSASMLSLRVLSRILSQSIPKA